MILQRGLADSNAVDFEYHEFRKHGVLMGDKRTYNYEFTRSETTFRL